MKCICNYLTTKIVLVITNYLTTKIVLVITNDLTTKIVLVITNYLTTKIVLVITNLCQIPPPIFFLCYECCDEREITLIPCKEQPSIYKCILIGAPPVCTASTRYTSQPKDRR